MHCINVVLIPPEQATDQKHIALPYDWKMQFVHEDASYQNAILISTDYFGGGGEQRATVIKDGQVVKRVEWNKDTYHPINDALRYFGLKKNEGEDEFDTIHLGRYRSDEDINDEMRSKYDSYDDSEVKTPASGTSLESWIEKIISENFKKGVVFLYNPNSSVWDEIENISMRNTVMKNFETEQEFENYLNSDDCHENIVQHFTQTWVNGKVDNSIVQRVRG